VIPNLNPGAISPEKERKSVDFLFNKFFCMLVEFKSTSKDFKKEVVNPKCLLFVNNSNGMLTNKVREKKRNTV